jgi:hypothetical protein
MRYLSTGWEGPTREEKAFKARANLKNLIVIALVAACLYKAFAVPNGAPHIPHAPFHVLASMALFFLSTTALFAEFIVCPAPKKGEMGWRTLGTIGHAAYFTVQTLMLQTIYSGFTFAAGLSESPALAALVQYLAVWIGTQGIALTLLFFKHNWYEPRWRRDVLTMMETMYPRWGFLMLYSHTVPCIVAVADLLLLKDPAALYNHGMSLGTLSLVTLVYATLYTAWTKLLQHVINPNTLIYPFIEDLNSPLTIGAFIAVQWVAVSIVGAVVWYVFVAARL